MRYLTWLALALAFVGCKELDPLYCQKHDCSSSGGDGGTLPPGFVTIAGTVDNSLSGAGLVLQNQGMDDTRIDSPGAFKFPPVMQGAYDVEVSQQPTNPSQNCTVGNGSGDATADVDDVTVTCMTATYVLSGTIIGLGSGQTATLDDGTDQIMVDGPATSFMFPALASGTAYNVTIPTNPNDACVVAGGMGKIGNADVNTVLVNCTPNTTTLGGMVTGLSGTVQLTNSVNNDVIMVSTNGTYAFDMTIPTQPSSSWSVTVTAEPTYPPSAQTCTVTNGSGSNPPGPAITNIDVSCTTTSQSISGTSSGVTGSVELVDNSDTMDIQTVTGSTSTFKFTKMIMSGNTYDVSLYQEPTNLGCTIADATGTVMNDPITNVSVMCAYKDPGIACGAAFCGAGTQACCDPEGGKSCIASNGSCSKLKLPCDDNADCSGGNTCCAVEHYKNGRYDSVDSVSCTNRCDYLGEVQLCDPKAANVCPSHTSCSAYSLLSGYYACQ